MKIVTIVGARPQFIKAAIVSRVFAASKNVREIIIHTGQHFETNMSDVFFNEMFIPKPNYNLNINKLGHGAMTGRMLEDIEALLQKEKPDWVLVYGDTNSTLAGALAAKKLHIKVAHIEAGLRSFNMDMPEEINRVLTDRISDILFCPTIKAVDNLKSEGYDKLDCRIVQCGDIMLDAAIFYADKAQRPDYCIPTRFILCTVHRAENTDDIVRLKSIFDALEAISKQCTVVMPLHPRTKTRLEDIQYDFINSKICLIPPLGYLNMIWVLKNCDLVMTDSGGLQKEAFFFKKNCVTLRDETEWVELVENRFNILAGSNNDNIQKCVQLMLQKQYLDFEINLYGEGDTGAKILNELQNFSIFSD
jgi:UDP-GlcNAc3NAcA epimerase